MGNRWNEVNRDRRVPVRFSLVSEAVSHESTVLPDSSFKTCKQWIIMSQSLHCFCDHKESGKEGHFSNYRNSCWQKTHTHTYTCNWDKNGSSLRGPAAQHMATMFPRTHGREPSRAQPICQLHQSSPTAQLVWNTSQQTAYKRWVFPILTAHHTKNKLLVQPFWAEPKPLGICLNKSLGICINISNSTDSVAETL